MPLHPLCRSAPQHQPDPCRGRSSPPRLMLCTLSCTKPAVCVQQRLLSVFQRGCVAVCLFSGVGGGLRAPQLSQFPLIRGGPGSNCSQSSGCSIFKVGRRAGGRHLSEAALPFRVDTPPPRPPSAGRPLHTSILFMRISSRL